VNGRPLAGEKGKLFRHLCGFAGIEPRDCIVTHVFDYQLPGNRLMLACTA
jgi:uracil-DNA glycosylase